MIELFSSREVAIEMFGWEIRWYGVLYLAAFGLVWWLLPRLQKYRGLRLSRDDWLFVLTLGLAGVLVGGRLGFVVFYELEYFLAHVMEIFSLRQGGMSIHGGIAGVGAALWLASRKLKINYWKLVDLVVAPAALGIAVGRIGNVVNQELFATTLAQFMAVGVNVVIAGILFWYLRRSVRSGMVTALFLILYGIARFGMEYFREQDYSLFLGLTKGQWLVVIVLLVGVFLLKSKFQNPNDKQISKPK